MVQLKGKRTNNFIESNNTLDDKFNLKKYLNKFSSRYNAEATIRGDRLSNYKLNAKLNGFIDSSKNDKKIVPEQQEHC